MSAARPYLGSGKPSTGLSRKGDFLGGEEEEEYQRRLTWPKGEWASLSCCHGHCRWVSLFELPGMNLYRTNRCHTTLWGVTFVLISLFIKHVTMDERMQEFE